MDIVINCDVILYILIFQDVIYNAIFRHYKLFNSNIKIKFIRDDEL